MRQGCGSWSGAAGLLHEAVFLMSPEVGMGDAIKGDATKPSQRGFGEDEMRARAR